MACHLLGIDSEAELEKSPFLGAIFEGFIAAEIIKTQVNAGMRRELYYFRDQQGLEAFAMALGPVMTGRMRRVFFERELEDLDLQVMADPAEQQVLVLPMGPGLGAMDPVGVAQALERVGLMDRIPADSSAWQQLDAVVAIPWDGSGDKPLT